MNTKKKRSFSYSDAGVDIGRAEQLIERIRPSVAKTSRPGVIGTIGGFGGLFGIRESGYQDPILVSSTDGVGTKLLLAIEIDRHDTIGTDLVAMCANDVVAQGAEPLLFLDYFATNELDLDTAEAVINGIADACQSCSVALLGGETAEMPGMYPPGHYDLAGFCVGAVERSELIDGNAVAEGDVILGLASNGVHANGYSLVRAILNKGGLRLDDRFGDASLGANLLKPTRLYVKQILEARTHGEIHAIAHITGGGLTHNLPRVLPNDLVGHIDLGAWQLPPIFEFLRDAGGIEQPEMLQTFNCGIGMVLVVAPGDVNGISRSLVRTDETVVEIGRVIAGDNKIEFTGSL